MLRQILDTLWIGDEKECSIAHALSVDSRPWVSVLHACKAPCHMAAVKYRGSLPKEHPEYLWAERHGEELYLNLIDPPVPLFKVESFTRALDFLDARLPKGDLLVHCNEGKSRAPSLALLWLSKRTQVLALDAGAFDSARQAFTQTFCKDYAPGAGLVTFLTEHWKEIR